MARSSFSTTSRGEETPTSTTATLSIGGMSSRNGTSAYGGLRGVALDSSSDEVGYEPVRSCGGGVIGGAIVDFDNRHSSSRPGIGNDKGVALPAGTFKAKQKEEQRAVSTAATASAASGDEEPRKEQRSSVYSSSVGTNPQTPRVQQQHQQQQQQLPPVPGGRMTLASAGSVGSSFQSLSRGSLSSFGMSRTPNGTNTSARKIMVSNLPRHSRRNKKPHEMTWLRDTLSLTSSTHSKEISYHDSGSDFNLHLLHNSSTNDMAAGGNQSTSSINEDGNDFNDSNGEFGVCVQRGGGEDRGGVSAGCSMMNGGSSSRSHRLSGSGRDNIIISNRNTNDREVPELFPQAATLPLPSIMASSMSSQSEEASSSSEDGGVRDDDDDDDDDDDNDGEGGKPETIHEGRSEGGSLEGRSREMEKPQDDKEDKEDEQQQDQEEEEEEEESDAPIKWITATISSREEEQLPPPPPRDRARRSSPSPSRSRSPTGRDRSQRSRGPGKDRWGGHDKSSNGFGEQRRRSPQNWSPRNETIPHGQNNKMNDSGEGRSVRRGGDNRGGEPCSTPAASKSVAAASRGGGNRRDEEERSRHGHRSGDGYYDDHDAPARVRSKELIDNSYNRQEEQSLHSRRRYDESPSRHGGDGRSRYPSTRDRHEPRTATRASERYPSRDRSPERYPPSDRSPERYQPKDRSPERYAPGESPSVYSRRENSPRNYAPRDRYPRRDGSPSERRSQRHHRSGDWGHHRQNRHAAVADEHSVYSRAPPGESRGYNGGAPEESPYRRGDDERSVYSRRREDPYERDYGRRTYDSDPYRGHRGGRDDRRLPSMQEDDYDYSRGDRYHSHYHSEVDGRRSHRNSPRYDDPYHHDDRSAYPQDEDRNRYGLDRSYPRRGYSMDDPAAYDDYPGPPPFHDRHSASPYASRYRDHHNDRYNDHHNQQQGRYDDHYGRPSPSSREQDHGRSSRYDYGAPPPPAAASPRQTNPKSHDNSEQAMLEEKLRNSSARGMDRGGNGSKGDEVSVEISPGVHVPLRRTHETMQAIAVDFYQSVSCLSCTMDVFCIADVCYVICPSCRVISPVTGQYFEGKKIRRHGLGLGFTCESLFKMQSEIMQDRSMNGKSERLDYGKQQQQERPPKGPTNDYAYERRERASISASHY